MTLFVNTRLAYFKVHLSQMMWVIFNNTRIIFMKVGSFSYITVFASDVCHQIKTLMSDQLNKEFKSNRTKTNQINFLKKNQQLSRF